jgi:hypothetical protein
MSIKTMMLNIYYKVNTQLPVGREKFSSPIDSTTYKETLSKLFIVSVLGTRLLAVEVFFLRSMGGRFPE